MQNYKINRNAQIFYLDLTLRGLGRLGGIGGLGGMGGLGQVGQVGQVGRVGLVGRMGLVGRVGLVRRVRRVRRVGASCIDPIVILYCFCIGGKGLGWGIFF